MASTTDNNTTNKTIMMETPPSSPPQSSSSSSSNTNMAQQHAPPAAVLLSPDSNVTHNNNNNNNNNKAAFTTTPHTPTPSSVTTTPTQVQTPSRSTNMNSSSGYNNYPHYPGFSGSANATTTISGGYGGFGNASSSNNTSNQLNAPNAPNTPKGGMNHMGSEGGMSNIIGGMGGMGNMRGGAHHFTADLTPVISNSNINYVDHPPSYSSSHTSGSSLAGFVVVSPAMMTDGIGEAEEDGMGGNLNYSPENGTGGGGGGGGNGNGNNQYVEDGRGGGLVRRSSGGPAVGLRQRRLPLPRAGMPPAKRSSTDAGMVPGLSSAMMPLASSALEDGPVNIMTAGAVGIGGGGGGLDEHIDGAGGGSLLGEGLAMPSGFYTDESSVENGHEDESGGRSARRSGGGVGRRRSSRNPIVVEGSRQQVPPPQGLAPIELKPNRKFFSFSGTSQYKRAIATPRGGAMGCGDDNDDDDDDEDYIQSSSSPFRRGLPPINSPSRRLPPTSPVREGRAPHTRQYQPLARGAHGVREMADTKDLDAIFKAPGPSQGRRGNGANKVSPEAHPNGPHPMMVDGRENEEREEFSDALRHPFPIDDRQWSIPSIRLANHVDFDRDNSFRTLSDDEYTEEDTLSYGDENDDASLSSKGSYEPSMRRRMISGVLRRASSSGGGPPSTVPSATSAAGNLLLPQQQTSENAYPAIGPTTSFLERNLGRISIENKEGDESNNAVTQQAYTFEDSETGEDVVTNPWSLPPSSIQGPPSILNVGTMPHSFDDAESQNGERAIRTRSSRRRRHGRRRRGESQSQSAAAFEWLQDLQNQPTNRLLIAEAASSKFMTGVAKANVDGGNAAPPSSSEDVTKALGMPHPLCRSSTIDPQYVHRAGFGFTSQGSSNGKNDIMLGGNNSIALTSSGSS